MNGLIRAQVGVDRSPPFWMEARLQGCRLVKTRSESRQSGDRFNVTAAGEAVVAAGTLLTFWTAGGEFGGTVFANYWILEANPAVKICSFHLKDYYLEGPLETLALGEDSHPVDDAEDTRALLLRDWWLKWAPWNGGQTAAVARWLGRQIRTQNREPEPFPDRAKTGKASGVPSFAPVDAYDAAPAIPSEDR